MVQIALGVRSATRLLVPAVIMASLLSGCEGRRQTGTQYGGTQPVPAPANNTNPGVTPVAQPGTGNEGSGDNGSGDNAEEKNNGGQQETPPADTGGLTADELEKGKAYVNGWDGLQDEVPSDSNWSMASVSATTTPGTGTGTGGTTGAAVSYEGDIKALLDANCVSCHRAGGSRAGSPLTTYAEAKTYSADSVRRIVAGTMPTGGALGQAQKDKFTAWQAGGFLEKAAAGGTTGGGTAGGTPPADSAPVLEITDQRYGDYLNEKEVVGKVGQSLKIVNKRKQGTFTIHTNGAPFPHGDAIQPGGSVDIKFLRPYSGDTDVYEHTDGSVNLDRKIKLRVTQ